MAQEPLRPAGKGVNFYSVEKEAALGSHLAAEFRKQATAIEIPTVQTYLDHLGHRIATHLPDANFPFTFSAIAEDGCPTIHEPAALPGGYIFVPAALFIAAKDENEFAGILAHAMEHIAQRHWTRQAGRSRPVNNSSIPLILIGGWRGDCSEGNAIPLALILSQQSSELEADFLAIQTMAHAGLDPMALVNYIQRVQPPSSANAISKTYSVLPDRDRRLANMLSAIAKLQTVNAAAVAPAEFAAAQQELRRFAETPVHPHSPPTLMRKPPE
jgi:beta-barrel assembly-enhancing protease